MAYQGKTDWNYDDLVTEQDMNRIEQGIEELSDELVKKEAHSLALVPGIQNVTSERDTPLKVTGIKGRTLVNLLGRDGNCEDLSRWGRYQVTNELDEDNFTIGTRGLKTIAASSGGGSSYLVTRVNLEQTKFYILLGMLKNGNAVDTTLSISGFYGQTRSNVVTRTDRFELAYTKITGLENEQSRVAVNITPRNPGNYVFADEIRLYEVTAEEFEAIDQMSPEEIAAAYPYVDSLQNVNAVYITNRSEDGRESYLYLPTCQLASNMEGTVADQMYMDNEGKPRVVRRFRRLEINDDVEMYLSRQFEGYKVIAITNVASDWDTSSGSTMINKTRLVDFDGRAIPYNSSDSAGWGTVTNHQIWQSRLYISIPNELSGWGDDYTPYVGEIRAFFNGWRMYQQGNRATPYTSGLKQWYKINYPNESSVSNVPTSSYSEWNHYLLLYQLAEPVDEPLEHEGSLMLYKGANQIEVGTGIVVMEKANPRQGTTNVTINGGADHSSKLVNRALRIQLVYRNSRKDNLWRLVQRGAVDAFYGIGAADLNPSNFDPSAVYHVTYLALDTYKLGIVPAFLDTEYASNLRGTVDDLVRGNKDVINWVTQDVTQILNFMMGLNSLGIGQGATPRLSTNLNNELDNGWLQVNVGTTLNAPVEVPWGLCRVDRRSSSEVYQTVYRTDTLSIRIFVRKLNSGNWTPWAELINSTGGTMNGTLKLAADIPLVFKGTDYDTPGKRNFRFDVIGDLFRLQALNENELWLRELMEVNHDGTVIRFGNGNISFFWGSGAPEGATSARIGSFYIRITGGTGTTLYVKRSGTGNTGWHAVA
ncbi:pyocin knob domain-containing protein [Paenibacillus senegalensis]|uniref:pyocin knob domain-containing protein n=1 Tax=Paenibacillus senegalensis TaxID=1465766 RepID=UPI000287C776|nr:pyocin knob domain-containing protein [Paenibacillus senegalensis]